MVMLSLHALTPEPESAGLCCEHCGSSDISVTDSRPSRGTVRRRRRCNHCGHRFTTYEVSADIEDLIRFDVWLQQLNPRDLLLLKGLAKQMRENAR